jgi:hypothetical protein
MAMRSVDTSKTNRAAAPCNAGRKRPLVLVAYDPAAADRRAKAARHSACAGALVQFLARPGVLVPSWLRDRLKLRLDLTVHFTGEKAVTATDLDGQQNRFRLPTEGVLYGLRPILIDGELDAANIPRVGALEGPKAPKKQRELLQGR